ncbi:MAG: hypothetical protein IMZ61_16230 [Planctomycetes bacterium]|nr:hypothetical protein [Planctomycetota bacterium]
MSSKVTANKQNQIKIRGRVNQAILKAIVACDNERGFYMLGKAAMVNIAELATSAVMSEPKIEIIAKKRSE